MARTRNRKAKKARPSCEILESRNLLSSVLGSSDFGSSDAPSDSASDPWSSFNVGSSSPSFNVGTSDTTFNSGMTDPWSSFNSGMTDPWSLFNVGSSSPSFNVGNSDTTFNSGLTDPWSSFNVDTSSTTYTFGFNSLGTFGSSSPDHYSVSSGLSPSSFDTLSSPSSFGTSFSSGSSPWSFDTSDRSSFDTWVSDSAVRGSALLSAGYNPWSSDVSPQPPTPQNNDDLLGRLRNSVHNLSVEEAKAFRELKDRGIIPGFYWGPSVEDLHGFPVYFDPGSSISGSTNELYRGRSYSGVDFERLQQDAGPRFSPGDKVFYLDPTGRDLTIRWQNPAYASDDLKGWTPAGGVTWVGGQKGTWGLGEWIVNGREPDASRYLPPTAPIEQVVALQKAFDAEDTYSRPFRISSES